MNESINTEEYLFKIDKVKFKAFCLCVSTPINQSLVKAKHRPYTKLSERGGAARNVAFVKCTATQKIWPTRYPKKEARHFFLFVLVLVRLLTNCYSLEDQAKKKKLSDWVPSRSPHSMFSSVGNLPFWKVKPMLKCLKLAFFLTASRGRLLWLQKEVWLYRSLWENDPTSHFIYYLSKHCKLEFMVSIASFKSSSIQHDVHLVNYCPI